MDEKRIAGHDEEVGAVLDLLEDWGSRSRFIWFQEIDRQTGIDRGLLRNILNHLKKTGEVREMHGRNKRIFFALQNHYARCRDAGMGEADGGSGGAMAVAAGPGGTKKSAERTRRRIEKQQKRREVKIFSRAKHKRRIGS